MKRILLLVSIQVFLFAAFAQQGSPLLTHFTPSRQPEDQSWAICQDDDQVMLFANRRGISTYDGVEWQKIRIPIIPYTMQKDPSGSKIYIGGDNNFGYLDKDNNSSYSYFSISGDSLTTGLITRIIPHETGIWFYSDKSVTLIDPETNKAEFRIHSDPAYPFTGMIVTSGNTFINVSNKGLHRIDSDTLFPIVSGYMTNKTDILFVLPYSQTRVLVGQSDGSLSLFDGMKYYDFPLKDEGYLRENILSEGLVLGDTSYAFSSLGGGVLVIEKKSGRVLYTINNQNDLPDDEVFALGCDNKGGLWLSHQYGLTRAALSLPVSNYTTFPGLRGNLSSALMHERELYVATSEGVFCLTEVKNYSEVEVLIKKMREKPVLPAEDTREVYMESVQGSRKNIFSRIFGRKLITRQESQITSPSPPPVVPEPVQKEYTAEYTKKTVSELKSIDHIYIKVEGLDDKCRQLVSTEGGILAATNRGLFLINNKKALPLIRDRYINYITWTPSHGSYYAGTSDGYISARFEGGKWLTDIPYPMFREPVHSILPGENNNFWLGGDNVAYSLIKDSKDTSLRHSAYQVKRDFPQKYMLDLIRDTIMLYTESGLYYFNTLTDSFEIYKASRTSSLQGKDYCYYPLSNRKLVLYGDNWSVSPSADEIDNKDLLLLKLFSEVVSVYIEKDDLWVIDGNNRLYGIERHRMSGLNSSVNVLFKTISGGKGPLINCENIILERGDNIINFSIVAPGYLKSNTTQYQYYIGREMDDWSPWSVNTNYTMAVRKPGEYVLQVRARDLWGNIGEPGSVKFTVTAAFIKTPFFYVITVLLLLAGMIIMIRFRERHLHLKNKLLEEKVRERTSEIEAQKEEITSSIEYAGRIQKAMLPMEELFKGSFSDYFIIFKPRDIVSGDFYWIGEDDKSVFFTVADCTGHGVPGAFMSTLGISTLNEIIANNHDLQANTVLNLLREKTKTALHQTGKSGEANDGMDIAFCILNKNRKILQFAGAFNSLYIFQGGEIKEYRADRMPIGIHHGDERLFTNHVISVNRGDTLYIFSDGFSSQFGGPDGRKYKTSNLKKILLEIYYRPLVEQRNILENEFARWQGSESQVDDVTIIGIRI